MIHPRLSLTIFLVLAFVSLTAVGLWMLDGVFAAGEFAQSSKTPYNVFVPFLAVSLALLAMVVAWAVWPLLGTARSDASTQVFADAGRRGIGGPVAADRASANSSGGFPFPVNEYSLHTYKAAVDHAPAAIMITNARGRIEYVNETFLRSSGYTREEVIGRSPAMFKSGHTKIEVYTDLWQTILSGKIWRGEVRNRRKNGDEYWENMAISPLRDHFGRVSHFVAVREDVTERRGREEDLRQLAQIDPLTGIGNRRYLVERAEHERLRAERFGQPLALLMLDIDHFKKINDRHGHAAGDEAICTVARTCIEGVREIDIVGRYGGEEFVILLPGTTLEGGRELAERLRQRIAGIELTDSEGTSFGLTASVGLASFQKGDQLEQMLASADAALYRAKSLGRNRVVAVMDCLDGAPPADVQ
ncbi:GGDEF domain-containing protein [Aromatoleum diolicum]|uniref:Diguanylate cyclase n=1 Tax=Aromatoleum diolicum TaxID=75796 RepID=A0ABX1QD00_9RHOO|nr:GGDEF domain-containing protein [Aromatoleum diolicum]NMG75059.1 diguanylate cyclase [Aromatoleum diolicum]